jgi:lauroyl/myristoyl acyltransferase
VTDVRIVRKPPKAPTARAAISGADVRTALRLMGSLGVAWAAPQAWWPLIARRGSWLTGKLAGKSTAKVASRIERAAGAERAGRLSAELRGARYEVAFQCLRGYRPGGWRPKIEVKGREHLDAALAEGKGAVLWVAHFIFAANVAKVGLAELGFRVSHLSRPDHGFSSTRFGLKVLNPVRAAFEDRYLVERIVFDRAHPAPALLRARKTVAAGGTVSFTAGAWEGSTLAEAPFLGSRITLAMGPVWLARASGAPLLPVFAWRTDAADRFEVEIGAPIEAPASAPEDAAMAAATAEFLRRLEPRVLARPSQWRGWSALLDP